MKFAAPTSYDGTSPPSVENMKDDAVRCNNSSMASMSSLHAVSVMRIGILSPDRLYLTRIRSRQTGDALMQRPDDTASALVTR